jgi:hypothetical protein
MKQANLLSYSRINSPLARAVTFRRVGPLHMVLGRPCDDFGDAIVLPEQKRIILACADGLGSAPQSRIGSQLSVAFALNQAAALLQAVKLQDSEPVLQNVANRTREYVRQVAMAVQARDAGKEINGLNSSLSSQRYRSYGRRWLTSTEESQILQFFDRWKDYHLDFSTTFFMAVIEESFARVVFSGDGSVGVIRRAGEATVWLQDKDLKKLKSIQGGSFTPTLWDSVKVSPVLECAGLTLATDGFSRFFNLGEESAVTPDLPGTESDGEDEIDVSDFICDDDGSDRSRNGWMNRRGGMYQEPSRAGLSQPIAKDRQKHNQTPAEVQEAQGGSWLKSLFNGFNQDSQLPGNASGVESSPSMPEVQSSNQQIDGNAVGQPGGDVNISGVLPFAPSEIDPHAAEQTRPGDNAKVDPTTQSKGVPLNYGHGDRVPDSVGDSVTADARNVAISDAPNIIEGASGIRTEPTDRSVLPKIVRKEDVKPNREPVPQVDVEPYRSLVDGTGIISNAGEVDGLIGVPTPKRGDDETCVTGAILAGSGFSSNISGYGIEETSNLRVMYGFKSTAGCGVYVKAVTVQPDVSSDQLVASIIVSLEDTPYEKAQKVGRLALQLLCDAIIRSPQKYETALLDVFRQVVTTRNADGRAVNVALIVHDSVHANYWCTGRFVAVTDTFVRIEPGQYISFGKFKVPFLIMPEGTSRRFTSRIHTAFNAFTGDLAAEAEVSRRLISEIAHTSSDLSFVVGPKVPAKEKELAKARVEDGLSEVRNKPVNLPLEKTSLVKPDSIGHSAIGGEIRPSVGGLSMDVPNGVTTTGDVRLDSPDLLTGERSNKVERKPDPSGGSTGLNETNNWGAVRRGEQNPKSTVSTDAQSSVPSPGKGERMSAVTGTSAPREGQVKRFLRRLFGG